MQMVTIMDMPGDECATNNGVPDQVAMVVGSPDVLLTASEDEDYCPSSSGSVYEEGTDLIGDEVTAQLAAAGPAGVAAAAAIVSAKKRRKHYSFETDPSIRKRQQNRLIRKLRQTIDEFATRIGQQAVVLVATPGVPNTNYKVFGAKPLEDVVMNLRSMVMEELENALSRQAPPPAHDDPSLFELPPLIIDGIPTPLEKMTQAQLRTFIPLMLKYSTGRGKPGWGRDSTRPPWWPNDLPWANVRMDARSEEHKQQISWTQALRQIVVNCYKFHKREDLLLAFTEDDEKMNPSKTTNSNMTTQFVPTVLHTITNPDGTMSIVQVDPNNPTTITLPDGTTATVQGLATLQTTQGDGSVEESGQCEVIDLNTLTEATFSQEGQLILTGEDGQGYPVSVSGVITVPISTSMYQSMVANIQHVHTNSDGTICLTPMVPKEEQNNVSDTMGALMIEGSGSDPPQVPSLKDATQLTNTTASICNVKSEETIIQDQ